MIRVGQKVFIIYKSKVISGYVKTIGTCSEGCYCTLAAGCAVPDVIKITEVFTTRVQAKLEKYKQELNNLNKLIKSRENERESLVRKINNIEKTIKD